MLEMIQRGRGTRFLLEAPQPIRVGRDLRRQDFDGDIATQPVVVRPIDLPHPATADGSDHGVRPKTSAGTYGHNGRVCELLRIGREVWRS
jgi:hypothetical protein